MQFCNLHNWGEQSKCSEGRRGRRSISGEIWGQSGGLELMPASHYPSTTTTTTDPTMAGALQCISGVALGVSGSSRSSCPKLINPRRSWPLVMVMVIFNPHRCQSRLHHTTPHYNGDGDGDGDFQSPPMSVEASPHYTDKKNAPPSDPRISQLWLTLSTCSMSKSPHWRVSMVSLDLDLSFEFGNLGQ